MESRFSQSKDFHFFLPFDLFSLILFVSDATLDFLHFQRTCIRNKVEVREKSMIPMEALSPRGIAIMHAF